MTKILQCFGEPTEEDNILRSIVMKWIGDRFGGDHVMMVVVRDGRATMLALERTAEGGKDLTVVSDLDKLNIQMKVRQ